MDTAAGVLVAPVLFYTRRRRHAAYAPILTLGGDAAVNAARARPKYSCEYITIYYNDGT